MLVSNSQSNVAAGSRATTESRSATMSYLRTSRLSSEPSPIQPPAGTPVSEATLPSALPTDTFTRPPSTPIQAWASSPALYDRSGARLLHGKVPLDPRLLLVVEHAEPGRGELQGVG